MGKGPGMFSDIGKRTRDLLNRDFTTDQKFSVTSVTGTGLTFTSTGKKRGDHCRGTISTEFNSKNVTIDVKVDSDSHIHGEVTAHEVAPGAKAVVSFSVPEQKASKVQYLLIKFPVVCLLHCLLFVALQVELHLAHEVIGLISSISLSSSPVIDVSAAIGNDTVSIGGDITYDSGRGHLARYGAGIGLTKPDFSAAILMTEKGDAVKASYCHMVNSKTKTTVAAEVAHKFSRRENTFTIGALYVLDPLTTVKARLNNHGHVGALLQHEWRDRSLVTICGEVDTKALNTSPKIGLALALNP